MSGVLFVCLGNICRSPLAAAVARRVFASADEALRVDSAGTGDWHVGQQADPRARAVAAAHGYPLEAHRARQVSPDDFRRFDWILAMDEDNLTALRELRPADATARVALLLDAAGMNAQGIVADPYYGGAAEFEATLALLERALDAFVQRLARDHDGVVRAR